MEIDRESNRVLLERISFHLNKALQFCNQLERTGLGPLDQRERDNGIKTCKVAISFGDKSIQELAQLLE